MNPALQNSIQTSNLHNGDIVPYFPASDDPTSSIKGLEKSGLYKISKVQKGSDESVTFSIRRGSLTEKGTFAFYSVAKEKRLKASTSKVATAFYIPSNSTTAASKYKGPLAVWIKHMMEKEGNVELYDDLDYDKIFLRAFDQVFSKNPFWNKINYMDKEDMLLKAFYEVVTPKTIKNYDPSLLSGKHKDIKKNTSRLVVYIWGMLKNRLINEGKKYMTKHITEQQDPTQDDNDNVNDFTDEERKDYKDQRSRPQSQHEELEYKELMIELSTWISNFKGLEKWGAQVFSEILKGKSNNEIAEDLSVSAVAVSGWVKKIQLAIVDYAEENFNEKLVDLMSVYGGRRQVSTENTAAMTPEQMLQTVFKKYKKDVGGEARTPKGEISKIRITETLDKTSDDFFTACLDTDGSSVQSVQKEVGDFFEKISVIDDLVEDDGKLIALHKVAGDKSQAADIPPVPVVDFMIEELKGQTGQIRIGGVGSMLIPFANLNKGKFTEIKRDGKKIFLTFDMSGNKISFYLPLKAVRTPVGKKNKYEFNFNKSRVTIL